MEKIMGSTIQFAETKGIFNLGQNAGRRHRIFEQRAQRLSVLAAKAIDVHRLKNDQFVMVCIEVDSQWKYIVDQLMPNYDWQSDRDSGIMPIAHGSAMFPICEHLAEKLPELASVLLEIPPEGNVKVVALDTGGATVYEIRPIRAD